ncbi:hypothetical protein K490DRAFT_65176 [Saccharata proteae CBS 121410]|uniref:Uncharacterized protein n=1 Tax=Saccharata proteae CBS 121410 TaxID=1314787 RepID=A0A9P4HWW3_9PEZI|nr:hypothetical protein K490DRAFT_65176 [Saccharata proteae CBS 121410]
MSPFTWPTAAEAARHAIGYIPPSQRHGARLCHRVTGPNCHGWGFIVYFCAAPTTPPPTPPTSAPSATITPSTPLLTTRTSPTPPPPRPASPSTTAAHITGHLQRIVEDTIATTEPAPWSQRLLNAMEWDTVQLPHGTRPAVCAHFATLTQTQQLHDPHNRYERLPLMIDAECLEGWMRGGDAAIVYVVNPAHVPDGWDRSAGLWMMDVEMQDPHPFWCVEGTYARPEGLWNLYHLVMLRCRNVPRLRAEAFGVGV